jgi:hypothetical protein
MAWAGILLLIGLAAGQVLAVHDEGVFELDGDPLAGSHLNNNSDPTNAHDWNQVYADFLANNHNAATNQSGAEAFSFVTDTVGQGDDILFGGATKDINDLPVWQSKQTGTTSVQDKDDIAHAFVAQYLVDKSSDGCGSITDPAIAVNCVLLYFGADRFANSGDTTMGFWLYHADVEKNGTAFTGQHQARSATVRGDLLIVADFLNGGAAPTVQVFEWVVSGGSASTHLDKIAGSDVTPAGCNGGPPPKQNSTPVPPVGANDDLCATTNQKVFAPTIWNFIPKANAGLPQTYPISTFMEGGLNLTALGFGNDCFSSFLAETRASHSVTSTLSDFALGGFGECTSSMSTTPSAPTLSGSTPLVDGDDTDTLPEIQIGTGDAGATVVDAAHVEVNGIVSWSGTVDFFICGPIDDPNLCDTGGVQAGAGIGIDSDNPDVISAEVNLTAVGRYCWRGEFTPSTASAAAGVEGAEDATVAECFEVTPVTPTLSTAASGPTGEPLSGAVPFGTALYDTAYLAGTANEPGDDGGDGAGHYLSINATNGAAADGSITFTLLGPGDCSTVATGSSGDNPEAIDPIAGDGDYTTLGFVTDHAGDFHWKAVYSGSTSGNTLGTDHNTSCNDSDEDVTVQQLQPTMSTAQRFVPNDQATITVDGGAGDLTGNAYFFLYVDDNTCGGYDGSADPTGFAYESGAISVSESDTGVGNTISAVVSSLNTTEYTSDHDFHWLVIFDSSNAAHLDVTSNCIENSSITIVNEAP